MNLYKLVFTLLGVLFTFTVQAQEATEKQDFNSLMRADGKVAVTIVISAIILTGMIIYLINAERRVKALEQEIGEE
ncbi:MAG TPA: hypothetical protein DCE41_09410 [Cytophagales bacterium]|nr:hypothetical protein [Cytophagales bacterium]HAA17441.1 hypothetical protein [Cytophagales bacterium]HAP62412.1 hypothetical protein [Cytophagales bacterium]